MVKKYRIFCKQGAIILDTILNYNGDAGSQTNPEHWANLAPAAHASISANGNRGDFLALVRRKEMPMEERLAQAIKKYHDQLPLSKR